MTAPAPGARVQQQLFRMTRWFAAAALALTALAPVPAAAQDKPLKKVTIGVGTQVLNIGYPWLMMALALAIFLVISGAVVAILWSNLYATDVGLINHLLAKIGVSPVPWLTDPRTAMPARIFSGVNCAKLSRNAPGSSCDTAKCLPGR